MGANQSEQNTQQEEGLSNIDGQEIYNEDNYEFIGQIDDPRLGEIKIVKHKESERKLAVKTKHCTSKQDFLEQQEALEQLKYVSHPNILRVIDIRSEKDEGFCSQVFLLRTVYEYINFDLEQETLSRVDAETEERNFFEEGEIIHTLQNIIAGLAYLKEKNFVHGDIISRNILISEDVNGNKIHKLHIPSYSSQSNHYAKVLRNDEDQIFLSPQQFQALGNQEIAPEVDQEKAEIFSAGIIGLQLCLLEETNSCYDFDTYTIKHDIVQVKLQQIADKYSQQLAELLISLLETEVENRANFQEALELLNEHPLAKDIHASIQEDYQNQSPQTRQLVESQQLQTAQKSEIPYQEMGAQDSAQFQPEFSSHSPQKLNYQNNNTNSAFQPHGNEQQQLNTSLKNIDQMVKEALGKSEETKNRYDQNSQIKQFMKELLDDEIFVPINPSPSKRQNNYSSSKPKQANKNTRTFRAEGWKI